MTLTDLESRYAKLNPSSGNEFIKSIHAAKKSLENDQAQLIETLERFVNGFQSEGRRICAEVRRMTDEERDALAIHARIIAALLLILQEAKSRDELRAKTLVFLEYASALVRTKYDFLMAALDVICYPVESLGLNWKIIEESTSVQLLTDLIIRNMKLDREHPEELSFTGHGKVLCRDGVLKVCSSEAIESGSLAFSVCQERAEVITRNSRDERLKASDQFNAEVISTFADFFRKTQKSFVDSSPKTRSYVEGDKVPIQITDIDSVAGIVKAKVMDSDVFIKGEIDCEEELIKGVYAKDIIPYLFDEDCIRDAILLRDEKGWYFSIRDTYSAYAQAMADSDARCGIHFEAVVIRVMPGWKRVNWITPSGYGGITRLEDTPGVKVGDKAVLRVFNIKSSGGDTYINLRPVEPVNNSFSKFVEVDSVLERFVAPLEEVAMNKETIPATELNRQRDFIKILSAILFNTAYRGGSIDAYRHLLVAEFLAGVVEDNASERAIREESDYLLQCLLFAQCGKAMLEKSKMLSEEDAMLCQQLSNWDSNAVLPLISDSFGRKKKEVEILSLMQGVRISEQFPDEVRVDKENVRKKICEILGVGDSFVRGGSVPKGKYGKVEMHKVEFKSSYVFI